jgi:hypothetical protein
MFVEALLWNSVLELLVGGKLFFWLWLKEVNDFMVQLA